MEHLLNARSDASATERLKRMAPDAALLANAHNSYWDMVRDIFSEIAKPSLEPDRHLRSVTQWRRMPWGVRVLDKPSSLGIDVGTPVPQVALAETIRTRAARNSKEFAIPPTFSLAHPPRPNGAAGRGREANDTTSSEMIEEAGRLLPDWGPYPELVNIQSDQGEWVFKFRNHESDATPSTVARGDHRTLWIVGGGHSLEGKFFLPDGLTAQEFGEHLASRFNVKNGPVTDGETNKSQTSRQGEEGPTLDWAALKKISATEFMRSSIERTFPEALSRVPFSILRDAYRTKVRRAIPSPSLMTMHLSFKRSCPAPG